MRQKNAVAATPSWARAAVVTLLTLCIFAPSLLAQEGDRRKQFDTWFPVAKRSKIEAVLKLRLDALDRVCQLSEKQRAKLALAGQGDIRLFWDRVETTREEFILAAGDRQKAAEVWLNVSGLLDQFNYRFFSDSSLLLKAVPSSLDPAQLKKYSQMRRERRRYRYEAELGRGIARIELTLPLRGQQRQQLIRLLVDSTELPEDSGDDPVKVVAEAMSQLPKQTLRPIFDHSQWQALSHYLAEAEVAND